VIGNENIVHVYTTPCLYASRVVLLLSAFPNPRNSVAVLPISR
jgi:hypothetical protein